MKKVFFISLAVIFGFALFMGCATTQTKDVNEKEALTMGNGGHKKMKIKVKKTNGKVVEVQHENGNPATPVTQQELDQIYQSPEGFQYVGVILYTHSSPGCYYYVIGGDVVKICW
jgi:hypothetical protein